MEMRLSVLMDAGNRRFEIGVILSHKLTSNDPENCRYGRKIYDLKINLTKKQASKNRNFNEFIFQDSNSVNGYVCSKMKKFENCLATSEINHCPGSNSNWRRLLLCEKIKTKKSEKYFEILARETTTPIFPVNDDNF